MLPSTKPYSYSQNEISLLAKAIGHPARIAIIEYLLKVNSCVCGEIVSELPLSQPTISQHLKELKSVGIIKGNSIYYCIDKKNGINCSPILKIFLFY